MNKDVAINGLQPSFNLNSFLDQPTSLRMSAKSVSRDRSKNNASAPVQADLKTGSQSYLKVESDYRDTVSRNQRQLNRSEVNLTKQAMYPKVQAQNFLGRNSSQAASTSRKSDHSAKPMKPQKQNYSGFQIRMLLDKVEVARKSSGKAEKLKKRLPLEAGLYLEHPSIFNNSKHQLNLTTTKLGSNGDMEDHRQLLRRFPPSPFENVRFMPVGQLKRKPEPVLQSCSPMSPQFDYLVAKTFLQGESTEMEARASRISKLQALCNKTASAVQELKNECRQGNFDLPQQTIGAHSQSQTTATNYRKKPNKIVTPIDLVTTGINLLYATTRVDSQLPEVTKLVSAEHLLTPKHKPTHAEDYGMSKDSAFVKFAGRGGLRAQSAVQRKRQANMIQLINKNQGTESLPGLHDKSKHRRIQSALHRYESESGTGFNSQLLKNYLRPKSTDTRLTHVEIQYLSGFIEKRLKEANTKNLQQSEMKELIESAIQQFLDEKQRQVKLPEIEAPLKKSITQATNKKSVKSQKSQKALDVVTNKSKTTIKSVSHIEIQDIDSHQTITSNKKPEEKKSSITNDMQTELTSINQASKALVGNSKLDQGDYFLHMAKAQSLKQPSSPKVLDQSEPIKNSTSPTKFDDDSQPILKHKQSMMQNMLLDGIWKQKWQDLKPVLEQRKRQERQNFFKQDSRQGNMIFQQIYDQDINKFKAMLNLRNSKPKEVQAEAESPKPIPQEKQKTPRKKDSIKRRPKTLEKLNIDISQVKGKKSHRGQKPQSTKSARQSQQSHRSKRSQQSARQPSQSGRKSVNFGLTIGQTSQQLAGIEDVMDTVKVLKKQITRKDTLREKSPSTKRSGTLSSPLQRGKSLKIILSRLSNGLTAFVDQNIDAPFVSEEVKAVMHGLRNKQALASGLSKAQLAVVVDEIKTELELLQKKASYTGHALHLMNLVDYYKPLDSPKPTLASSQAKLASTTNILIKTVSEDLPRNLIKKVATFALGQALEPIQPEPVNKENPNMKYIKPIEEQKIGQLLRGSVKNSVFEEELEFKIETCGGIAKGLLSKEQLKVHLLDWKQMETDIREQGNFILSTDEMLAGELSADSFEAKHGFNILGKFLATTDLIRDEHSEPHLRRTNSLPRAQQQDERRREQPKAGCHFWPKAFESENANSFNGHLHINQTLMAGFNPQQNASALREEISNGKSLLYDEFWSENGRLTDLFSEELRMQSKWTVDEEEKVNRLEGQIMHQIEGIEIYNMIAPKHSDKSKQVAEVEKMFQKRSKFFTGSFLDVSQVPECSRVVVLSDWKLKCLNQDALEYKCIGDPNTKPVIKTFQDALRAKIKREAASYIEFADIKLAEPSVDLLWLLYFDEQLISSMANILSTPFNPVGVLQNIRMELNIVYINQFEKYLLKIKGKRMKRVGINFKVKKAKLLAGAQSFFGDHVVRRNEAQSKIAVHFMRSNRNIADANEYLLNFSQVLRPHRELQSTRDIHELKKQFSLPTILDLKNDVAMQPYITHDLTPLRAVFRSKKDRPLYSEHRQKLVGRVWDRIKSKTDEPLELVTLSSHGSSEKSEKDYDQNLTQVEKSNEKVSSHKSKPLFYQYAPVIIEQFPYELDAFGDRVNIIHKNDAVHSLFKVPVRLYQHFYHVSGFQFQRKAKQSHQEITFYDIYLPARKKPLISKLQDALRQILTRKLLEMQQVNAMRKELEEVKPKIQTKPESPVKVIPTKQLQVKEASPEMPAKSQPLKMSKSRSSCKKQKFKPTINVGTTMKKSKSSYPGSKEAGNLTCHNKKSPSRQSYLGSDFQSQLTYLSKQTARKSSRKSTMKAVIYAHPQKKKQIEVGITAASPQNRKENESQSNSDQQELPMRRATSAIIKGDQSSKRSKKNLSTPKHKPYMLYKTFDNKSRSAAQSCRSAVTYSKVSETQSISDTPEYSPISQSLIKANKEPCEPSKPLKLIAASELVKQYPMTKKSQDYVSAQALNLRQQLIDSKKFEVNLLPKKSTIVQLPQIFASMSDSVTSSSLESNKPSRAEKLQKLLEEKEKIKKEKLKLIRAKSKKKASTKEAKVPRQKPTKIDTPKKHVKRIESLWKESESSPDWQVNKSNKTPKQFQLNLLQSPESPQAVTPTYPKFLSKKSLQQLKRKMQE